MYFYYKGIFKFDKMEEFSNQFFKEFSILYLLLKKLDIMKNLQMNIIEQCFMPKNLLFFYP
jgi:hypothetical protein